MISVDRVAFGNVIYVGRWTRSSESPSWKVVGLAVQDAALAAKDAEIAVLKEQVATLIATVTMLTKQVAELTERLGRNSRNSHLPPVFEAIRRAARAPPATAASPRAA